MSLFNIMDINRGIRLELLPVGHRNRMCSSYIHPKYYNKRFNDCQSVSEVIPGFITHWTICEKKNVSCWETVRGSLSLPATIQNQINRHMDGPPLWVLIISQQRSGWLSTTIALSPSQSELNWSFDSFWRYQVQKLGTGIPIVLSCKLISKN